MKASDYVWIAKWGRMMGSASSYIKAQQERALAAEQPTTVIYEHADPGGRPNGEWADVTDVTNPSTRQVLGLT